MYNDSELNIMTHVPLLDGGGGGCVFSILNCPPTGSAPAFFKEKRFCKGDVNPSDGSIFWCYKRSGKETWFDKEEYNLRCIKARAADTKYRRGEAYANYADRRRAKEKKYSNSPKGRERDRRKARKRWANPEWRKRRYERLRRKHQNDPVYALRMRARSRVYTAIKNGGGHKSEPTEQLVGCSFEFLRQHIERQFTGKMSWDNPGSFEIDHIVPVSAFDLTDPAQVKVACNWQNLRPLSRKKNRSKGAKLTEPQLHLPLTITSSTTYTSC
jgi:hypothetical protein